MSERDMRSNLTTNLKAIDAIAVENPAGPGTPDINFIGGWVECKWLRVWPKRPETPVRLDHPFTPEQKAWHRKRTKRGERTWVLLQCRREWFLFDGLVAAEHLGTATRGTLGRLAERHWEQGLNANELIVILENSRPVRQLTDGDKREARWKALGGSW